MYKNGELDASVAMQLLGGACESAEIGGEGTKRPVDSQDGDSPDVPSVDEILHQAKRAKMDPL